MHRNSDTIVNLRQPVLQPHEAVPQAPKPLVEIKPFGSNPGSLRGFVHVPVNLRPDAPLVVVLHGCTQTAAGYSVASGWSQLAEDLGFVLLFPEQRVSNNLGLCFNWFEPEKTTRDSGEVLSIRQMITAVQSIRAIDPKRIFITGFSGGGAMTAAMLATYPEVFAGGAIIAGVPYGVASGMVDAFSRMQGRRLPDADVLAAKIAQASPHTGPWPSLSIWHGAQDHTVNIANADALARQWRTLNNLSDAPDCTDTVDGVPHRAWRDTDGRIVVEDYIVPAMGHGVPLDLSTRASYGAKAAFMLDVGISSTLHIAQSWNLAGAASGATPSRSASPEQPSDGQARQPKQREQRRASGGVIAKALRAIGLKR